MTIWCKHVHGLELQKKLNFCFAQLPGKRDIETRFPISYFGNFVSISRLTGKCAFFINSFIHTFIHSFARSFARSLVRSFVYSFLFFYFIYSCIHASNALFWHKPQTCIKIYSILDQHWLYTCYLLWLMPVCLWTSVCKAHMYIYVVCYMTPHPLAILTPPFPPPPKPYGQCDLRGKLLM